MTNPRPDEPLRCPFCNQPVDPDAPNVARQVSGFTNALLTTGEVFHKRLTGVYAHELCVEEAERRATGGH